MCVNNSAYMGGGRSCISYAHVPPLNGGEAVAGGEAVPLQANVVLAKHQLSAHVQEGKKGKHCTYDDLSRQVGKAPREIFQQPQREKQT